MRNDEKTTSTIIPAAPGWELAVYIKGGDDYVAYISCEPIIAWDIERSEGPFHPSANRPGEHWVSREVTPITVGVPTIEHFGNIWAIKRPDGKFEQPDGATISSEEELLAACIEQQRYDEEAKQAKKTVA